jgi:HlyD family secretion protein
MAALALFALAACHGDRDGGLRVNGTIEADEVRVATTLGGPVVEVRAREGDVVEAGRILLRLDTRELELQARRGAAAVRQAEAQLALARKGARAEDIAAAREGVTQAETALAAAEADRDRAEVLSAEGATTEKQADDAGTRVEILRSQLRAAQQQHKKALRGARPEELQVAEAGLEQAQAALALLEKKIGDAEVVAPSAGTVVHRLVEPGEIVGPGMPLFILEELSVVRLKVYVPEADLGRVRLGDRAQVTVDSFEDRTFEGRVTRINDRAEFTPKNVQTKDERVKLVFAVEVELDNQEGYLKPGLPADALFEASGEEG